MKLTLSFTFYITFKSYVTSANLKIKKKKDYNIGIQLVLYEWLYCYNIKHLYNAITIFMIKKQIKYSQLVSHKYFF